jgi:hypothetical protein
VSQADSGAALDPLSLTTDLTTLESTALVAQAHALVVERQQDAGAYVDDPALAVQTRDSQEELRTGVEFYLNRLLPDTIARMADGDSAANFLAALATASAGAEDAALPGLVKATLTQFETYRKNAVGLSTRLNKAATQVSDSRTALEALLKQEIDALEGDEGAIQKTRTAIAETRDAISKDLSDVVAGANNLGKGVSTFITDKVKFVTGIFSTFGGSSSEDGGGSADGGDDTTGGKKDGKPFDVESMDLDKTTDQGSGEASEGTAEIGKAVASFHEHNDLLAELYHTLAKQKVELAVAAAISDQADNFARGLNDLAEAAAAVAATWQSVLDAAQPLRDADPADLPSALASALEQAGPNWSAMSTELTYVRAALAGGHGRIANVGTVRKTR